MLLIYFKLFNNSESKMQYQTIYLAKLRKVDHISCIIPSSQTHGAIFLGNVVCLIKTDLLTQNQIQAVLTCSAQTLQQTNQKAQILKNIQNLKITHLCLSALDTQDYSIQNHFQQSFKFVSEQRLKKKNVLVHCHAGKSRSATIIIAYLMRQLNLSANESYNFVKQKRSCIEPNKGFKIQLEKYEKQMIEKNLRQKIKSQTLLQQNKVKMEQNKKNGNSEKLYWSNVLNGEQQKKINIKKRRPLQIKQKQINVMKNRIQKLMKSARQIK